ncbi:unnamed protein product [Calicophoron daubneyi]|uniref:Uncharacterized protein n=1 Tax=Calicophoron daubneyi TaxID=300641 RepID=A0AAV2TZP8_CALDB
MSSSALTNQSISLINRTAIVTIKSREHLKSIFGTIFKVNDNGDGDNGCDDNGNDDDEEEDADDDDTDGDWHVGDDYDDVDGDSDNADSDDDGGGGGGLDDDDDGDDDTNFGNTNLYNCLADILSYETRVHVQKSSHLLVRAT